MIHVSGPGGSVLLPGDIQSRGEWMLLNRARGALSADILLVPHHGSRTSSTGAFLEVVNPRLAINSSGHRNRFRHPSAGVVRRYRTRHIRWLDTACDGEVQVLLAPGRAPSVQRWLDHSPRFWHSPDVGAHCRR